MLYDYIFGKFGLTTALQNSSNTLSAVSSIFDSPFAYNIAVAVFAVFIGLFVYVLLEGIDHLAAEASGKDAGLDYISDASEKQAVKKELKIRTGLRVVTLIVWIGYFLFFIKVIVPSCILLGRIDTAHLLSWTSIGRGLAALTLLVLAIHVQTIFLRLLMLRPRVFGIQNIVVGRGGHDG